MPDPGVYLVNSTGDMTPLDVDASQCKASTEPSSEEDGEVEGGTGDGELFTEVIEENTHPHECPLCHSTIRSTGGGESLYDDGTDKGVVIKHDLIHFSNYELDDEKEHLHYCPNDDCRIERLTPGEH